jgi:hypothetical protein
MKSSWAVSHVSLFRRIDVSKISATINRITSDSDDDRDGFSNFDNSTAISCSTYYNMMHGE